MAAIKPSVEITFDRWHMASWFQLPPLYFRSCPTRICMLLSTHTRRRLTLPDVDRQPKIKTAATETGNGNNNWTDWACDPIPTATPTPHISDHAGHVCDTADADRRFLVIGIQYGGHYFRFRWPPSWISVVGRRRTKSTAISMSGMVKNMGVEIEIAAPSITFERLFPLPV